MTAEGKQIRDQGDMNESRCDGNDGVMRGAGGSATTAAPHGESRRRLLHWSRFRLPQKEGSFTEAIAIGLITLTVFMIAVVVHAFVENLFR